MANAFLVLLIVFFIAPDVVRWSVLLPGLAWRAWLFVLVLPSWLALAEAVPEPRAAWSTSPDPPNLPWVGAMRGLLRQLAAFSLVAVGAAAWWLTREDDSARPGPPLRWRGQLGRGRRVLLGAGPRRTRDGWFLFLASGATAQAPEDMSRGDLLAAIGRGIGRTAAHELAHLILPTASIHDGTDVRSYEFDSAARREQYFGDVRWALARPWLEARLGRQPCGRAIMHGMVHPARPIGLPPIWRALGLVAALGAAGCAASAPTGRAPSVSRFAPDAPDAEYRGVATGQQGAVSSTEANASDIGVEVLRRGGNAVDAAVAVAFALGVTHPSAGNIGGGGFLIVRTPDGRSTAFDYREVAPSRASERMFLDAEGTPTEDSRIGPRAAGIPGVVRGLEMAHRRFGRLPWRELVAPSARLARDGWPLDTQHADDLATVSERMQAFADALPADRTALRAAMAGTLAIVRKSDGQRYRRGDIWRQQDLAATLDAIAAGGADAFYTGPLAQRLADEVTRIGGIWSAEDLAAYTPIEREPIRFTYHGHEIVSMPPPSAGGINLRQILAGADALGLERHAWESPERIHLYVEIMRRAFADSTALMGDPGFVDVPQRALFDPGYARRRMASVDRRKATPSSAIGSGVPIQESPETTHFSVIDRDRMAVASTFTLNGDFGAKVVVPGTGVILNNEMDDFSAKPGAPNMFGLVQSARNAIAPGKRMVSSMTPTIVAKDGKVRAIVGSPGGPTIISTVAQIVLQLIDYDRSLAQAVGALRVHHQWLPDEIAHEEALPAETVAALRAMGHQLKARPRMGVANCIEVDPRTGALTAVADVKRDGGRAAAY